MVERRYVFTRLRALNERSASQDPIGDVQPTKISSLMLGKMSASASGRVSIRLSGTSPFWQCAVQKLFQRTSSLWKHKSKKLSVYSKIHFIQYLHNIHNLFTIKCEVSISYLQGQGEREILLPEEQILSQWLSIREPYHHQRDEWHDWLDFSARLSAENLSSSSCRKLSMNGIPAVLL